MDAGWWCYISAILYSVYCVHIWLCNVHIFNTLKLQNYGFSNQSDCMFVMCVCIAHISSYLLFLSIFFIAWFLFRLRNTARAAKTNEHNGNVMQALAYQTVHKPHSRFVFVLNVHKSIEMPEASLLNFHSFCFWWVLISFLSSSVR